MKNLHPRRALALLLACLMALSLLPASALATQLAPALAFGDEPVAEIPAEAGSAAEQPARPLDAAELSDGDPKTYYVSLEGNGANDGLSEAAPFPGLDAVPWSTLQPGDSVLLRKGDTFPGAIRLVGVNGTAAAPITIGAYGTETAAPVIETRGQGIWLQETGSTATLGKYASSGVLLYDCSYIKVEGLDVVNLPDPMKATLETTISGKSNCDTIAYSGVAVAADGKVAAAGIQLKNITVHGDASVQTVITETSSTVTQTNVTKGAAATERTLTNAAGTYYVSSKTGSDSNNGTSASTPFYSLHKINELNLQPGAKVYLEYGSVFENQYLHFNGGGSSTAPVIVDAYGNAGNGRPLINTNGNGVWYQNYGANLDNGNHVRYGYVSSCINLYDVPYIEIKNIAMTNGGDYGKTVTNFDPNRITIEADQEDGGTVPGETGYNSNGNIIGTYTWGGKMSRTGVSGVAQDKGTISHTYLQNLDIEKVYGNVYIKHMNNGGIYFTVAKASNEASTGIPKFDGLRIEGCYLRRVSRWGIAAAYTAYWARMNSQAISDEACQTYGSSHVYIGHNYLEEVGGDPITTMYDYEPLIEYNVALRGAREIISAFYHNGSAPNGNGGTVAAGIWPWKCKTALFEHNECYDMMHGGNGNNDAEAWDADYGDSTIYQYNYSSGNTGGCVMYCAWNAYNTVFRYNISYKDGKVGGPGNNIGPLDFATAINGQMYNNTFLFIQDSPAYHRNNGGNGTYIENNIFYNTGNTPYDPQWTNSSALHYNNNIYSGFSSTGDDANPIVLSDSERANFFAGDVSTAPTEPQVTNKAGTGNVNGIRNWTYDWDTAFNMFQVKSTATAVKNVGLPHTYIGLIQDDDFGVPRAKCPTDFFGNVLDAFHDIGAHDTGAADPEGVTVVSVDHQGATIQWSLVDDAESYKVSLDGDEPVAAAGASYHTFTGLFPLAEYTVSVTAYNASGEPVGAARTATFTTARTPIPDNTDTIRPTAVKAGSEHSSERKENAIDGNTSSIWHTNWDGSAVEDRWIAVDLGRVQSLKNFKYLPRQDSGDGGGNGVITQYEIYISSADSDWANPGAAGTWTKAKEGNWAQDKTWKTVTFDAGTSARYVKLKCVAGVNNHASAAEITLEGSSCTGLTLQDASVAVGKTKALEMTTTPAGSAPNNIVWTSSNRKVATVNDHGQVTALAEGTTTITAHLPNNTTATCTVTVIPRELSDACALVSSLFEVRDTNKLQVPYTAQKPTTVAELKAGLEVSEAATVQVLQGTTPQADSANVAADMTVRILAENGEAHTDYVVVQKNTYNSNADWLNQTQGNVWFYQYHNGTGFVNHTAWDSQWNCWGGASPKYQSVERNQACGSITESRGSGFTFRAPADGSVKVQLFCYDGTNLLGKDKVRMRQQNPAANTISHYVKFYINGEELPDTAIPLQNNTELVDVAPMTLVLAQGDVLSVMAWNGGDFSDNSGNNGIFFNPVMTYLDQPYVPNPAAITLNETEVSLSTNDPAHKTVQLTASVAPAAASQTVTWSVRETDTSIVSVSSTGLVTALADGDAVVYARAARSWGDPVEASCTVHVSTGVTGVTVQKDGAALTGPVKVYVNAGHANRSVTLTAAVEPANATNKTVNWTRPDGAQGMISVERADSTGASATITALGDELSVGAVTVEAASAASPDVKATFQVHVVRELARDVYVTGDPKVGSTLTASTVELVMKDAAKDALKYQWYRGAVDDANKITGATRKTYTVTEADIGATLSVAVTADPDTFYEGTRTASAAQAVAKMAGPAAPEGLTAEKCTDGNEGGKIKGLDAAVAYEYLAENATTWTAIGANSTEVTLPAGTYQVRIAATTTREASAAVTKTILPAAATGYDITVEAVTGGAIRVSKNPAVEDDEITVTATPDTGYELVENSLKVTKTGEEEEVTLTDGAFTMPAYGVTVTAQFRKRTFTITHDLANVTCTLGATHPHTVEYGDQPVITLNANEGYTMPANLTVTKTGSNPPEVFHGYTYSHKAATPDTATLTFTQGITEDLTISGTVPTKTYAVNYTLTNGLTAPADHAPRSVGHKAAYSGILVAQDAKYTLPLGVVITMGGEPYYDFDYNYQSGIFTIEAGKITGDLVVKAAGRDATVPVKPVTGVTLNTTTADVAVGRTITLTATVAPADATEKSVIWSSSDETIARVNESGVVTGVAEGSATITVTTVEGHLQASCTVTVTKQPASGGGGGVAAPAETTKTETKPDGSKVTTVTQPDGAKTVTVTTKDGEEVAKVDIPATIPAPADKFIDMDKAPWAEKAVNNVAGLKLVEGIGGNKYDPVAPMTRGSLATVLHRLSSKPAGAKVTFNDVADGKFYTEGVAWAAKVGVVTGISADVFAPEKVITREQLAVMLARYADLIGLDTKADAKTLEQFTDGAETGTWAVEGVAWCVKTGILQGKGQNNLDPTTNVTRAEVAVMLDRFIALIK